jgi:hypothetical protein
MIIVMTNVVIAVVVFGASRHYMGDTFLAGWIGGASCMAITQLARLALKGKENE